MSPDLQLARVYYTTIGTESQRKATVKALRRALPFLHYQIGKRLRLRRVPVLEFFFDKSALALLLPINLGLLIWLRDRPLPRASSLLHLAAVAVQPWLVGALMLIAGGQG